MVVCYSWLGPRYLDRCQKLMATIPGPLSGDAYERLRGAIFDAGHFREFRSIFTDVVSRPPGLTETMDLMRLLLGDKILADLSGE